jgi:hypothetical protein
VLYSRAGPEEPIGSAGLLPGASTGSPPSAADDRGYGGRNRLFSEEAIKKADEPEELFWINGARHIDVYDKDEYVTPAVAKLADFFGEHLARKAQRADCSPLLARCLCRVASASDATHVVGPRPEVPTQEPREAVDNLCHSLCLKPEA